MQIGVLFGDFEDGTQLLSIMLCRCGGDAKHFHSTGAKRDATNR
jgi:hypothetical protein